MTYVLFVIGFFLLIKGADLLVDGASVLAKRFHLSDIVIGLTIVAFGTSAPELVVNIVSSISGSSGLVLGNILGSNIANIALILGISAIIYPLTINKKTIFREIPFAILSVALLGLLINNGFFFNLGPQLLGRIDGIVLLLFFALFMRYIFHIAKEKKDLPVEIDIKKMSVAKMIIFVVLGLTGLTIGGKWIVNGAIDISRIFGISESVIGLTIVALGTSLPELATSVVAVMKKKSDIAIGNVVGSNIFNILRVLGVSALIRPISGIPTTNRDIVFTLFISLILFLFVFIGRKYVIQKYQGLLLVLLYIAYMCAIVMIP